MIPQLLRSLPLKMNFTVENQSVAGLSWKKLDADAPSTRPDLEASDHRNASERLRTTYANSMAYSWESSDKSRLVREASKVHEPITGLPSKRTW